MTRGYDKWNFEYLQGIVKTRGESAAALDLLEWRSGHWCWSDSPVAWWPVHYAGSQRQRCPSWSECGRCSLASPVPHHSEMGKNKTKQKKCVNRHMTNFACDQRFPLYTVTNSIMFHIVLCFTNIHWASKETYHFFRATRTKIQSIKINHIWTQISYSSRHKAHLKNQRVAFAKKEKKCGEIAKGNFSKITETTRWEPPRKAAYSEHSIARHSISKAGYVTAVLAIVCNELRAREASSFCDFWKITSCDFTLFHSVLTQSNVCFLRSAW